MAPNIKKTLLHSRELVDKKNVSWVDKIVLISPK